MGQTLEDIADRIIICGLDEMQMHLETGAIGAVVTACTSIELARFNHPDIEENTNGMRTYNPQKFSGIEILNLISSQQIEHHQSLLYEYLYSFEEALGISKKEFEAMPEDELEKKGDEFFASEVKTTLKFIDDFFRKNKDQKIMIHCAQGSDRSAMIAVAYMCQAQGNHFDIDLALRQLQRIRPRAALDAPTFMFKGFFASGHKKFADTAEIYSNTIYSKALVPCESDIRKYATRKEGPVINCLKAYFDDMAKMHNSKSRYFDFISNCARFRITPPTWRL